MSRVTVTVAVDTPSVTLPLGEPRISLRRASEAQDGFILDIVAGSGGGTHKAYIETRPNDLGTSSPRDPDLGTAPTEYEATGLLPDTDYYALVIQDDGMATASSNLLGPIRTAEPDAFTALRLFSGTTFNLAAAKVAARRELAATATAAFDSETEHSSNGWLVKQATGADQPTIRTDTGAVGGTWVIRGANDDLDVRNPADSANVIGTDLMPTTGGTYYAVFRCNDGGENSTHSVVIGSQSAALGVCIAIQDEIRCGGGDMGAGAYTVPGVEPTAALVGVIYKWNGTTLRARKLDGAWVDAAAGSGANITTALGAAVKLFSGSGGVSNDMDICIAGAINVTLTDAQVDDDGGLADLLQAAWDASVAT